MERVRKHRKYSGPVYSYPDIQHAQASGIQSVDVLADYFLSGLQQALAYKIIGNGGTMADIEDYYSLASRLDIRFSQFQSKQPREGGRRIRATTMAEGTGGTGGVAIQKLTPAERDRLRKEGKCFACRQAGHMSRECPNKKNFQRNIRQVNVPETIPEVNEGISVGKIVAMMSRLPAADREELARKMVDEGF